MMLKSWPKTGKFGELPCTPYMTFNDTGRTSRTHWGAVDNISPNKDPAIVYCLTLCANVGGFLLGYDTGVISGALILIDDKYDLKDDWAEWLVASTAGMAAIFALIGGIVADKIGRKLVIMVSAATFTGGGICMGIASGPATILLGRMIVGVAIGCVSSVVPVYISECAPVSNRCFLVTLNQLFITFGVFLSAICAGAFQDLEDGWRYMLGMSAVPASIQFVCLVGLPESPRYLMMKNKHIKAELTLKRIRQTDAVTLELAQTRRSVQEKKGTKGWMLWKRIFSTHHARKALFLGCMLQMFHQICGINAVVYYSSTILKTIGFPKRMAIWLPVLPTSVNFLTSFIAIWSVDSMGRKLTLVFSFLATAFALLVMCAAFLLLELGSPLALIKNGVSTTISQCNQYSTCYDCYQSPSCGFCYFEATGESTNGYCVVTEYHTITAVRDERCDHLIRRNVSTTINTAFTPSLCPFRYGWLVVIGMVLYMIGYAPGAGPMPWTINADIYPQWSRSVSNSLAAVTNWTSNFIVSYSFLILIRTVTTWGTFLMFCAMCIFAAIFVLIYIPETKGKTLEDIELLFMNKKERREAIAKQQISATVQISFQDLEDNISMTNWASPSYLSSQYNLKSVV